MRKSKFGDSQYEAHVTLGKMDARHKNMLIMSILPKSGFKITDIITMLVKGLEQEEFDTVITGKGDNLRQFTNEVQTTVLGLRNNGFEVLRYKIESTVVDSKFEDKFKLL